MESSATALTPASPNAPAPDRRRQGRPPKAQAASTSTAQHPPPLLLPGGVKGSRCLRIPSLCPHHLKGMFPPRPREKCASISGEHLAPYLSPGCSTYIGQISALRTRITTQTATATTTALVSLKHRFHPALHRSSTHHKHQIRVTQTDP